MTHKQQSIRGIRRGAHGVRLCLGIVVAISAAACAPPPKPTHQTVDYYRANADERKARLVECENDPGALGQTPDCINAHRADKLETPPKSLRDLPPMGLLDKDGKPKSQGSTEPAGSTGSDDSDAQRKGQ